MYCIQSTLHTMYCIQCTLNTIYCIQYTLNTVYCIQYTVHTMYNLHYTVMLIIWLRHISTCKLMLIHVWCCHLDKSHWIRFKLKRLCNTSDFCFFCITLIIYSIIYDTSSIINMPFIRGFRSPIIRIQLY